MKNRSIVAGAFSVFLCVVPFGSAFSALPDGASSLNETYQDWQVVCKSNENITGCSMVHNQVAKTENSTQRVLSIELTAPSEDKIQGVLLMPFGLALANGASINIDGDTDATKFGFSTCIPQGCIVPIEFSQAMIDKLKNGGAIDINATLNDNNQAVKFTASLKGFTAAYNRLNALR